MPESSQSLTQLREADTLAQITQQISILTWSLGLQSLCIFLYTTTDTMKVGAVLRWSEVNCITAGTKTPLWE